MQSEHLYTLIFENTLFPTTKIKSFEPMVLQAFFQSLIDLHTQSEIYKDAPEELMEMFPE